MKYVKITQTQLNEIEELIREKNIIIKNLGSSVNELSQERDNLMYLADRRYETIKELAPFRVKATNEKMFREESIKAHKKIDDLQAKLKKLNAENEKLSCQNEILETTLEKSVQMLNEASKNDSKLDVADLSNILDVSA